MMPYDPGSAPAAADWLRLDEAERIVRVLAFHRDSRTRLPNAQLHAVIHVVVENQLALGEAVVAEAMARLQGEGLSRHDALHAIGSVLVSDLYALMHEGSGPTDESYRRYLDRLRLLTARSWRAV